MNRVVALALAAAGLLHAAAALAGPRVALVIGNDVGDRGESPLRYAQTDARRVADVLVAVGDVAPADLILLQGASADAVRSALKDAENRLGPTGDGVLLVYYSGHSDAEALHLGGTRLPLSEVQAMLRASRVATRLLIVDACRSGALTYMKGGSAAGRFEIAGVVEPTPRGLAIVSSAAAGEDAQESDELRASFFTHHLTTGMLGAADENGDGVVTLGEAFAYSAQHTIASTATTWAGPQHPTYRLDLGGREDLVLTRPGTAARGGTLGYLTLGEPGNYLVRRVGEAALVAEVSGDAVNRPLALRMGHYEVTRRARDHLLTGTFDVAAATTTEVTAVRMRRVEYGRAVRKGGTAKTVATAVYASGGYRGSLLGLGAAPVGGIGAQIDLRRFSATVSFDFAESSIEAARGARLDTAELGVRAGLYRAVDLSRITVALGAEIGGSRFGQSSTDGTPSVHSFAASAGPSMLLQLPIHRRAFASLQAALPVYLLDARAMDRDADAHAFRITYRVTATVGACL